MKKEEKEVSYEILRVKLSSYFIDKLDKLSEIGLIRSRGEGLRRSLELLFEKYYNSLS